MTNREGGEISEGTLVNHRYRIERKLGSGGMGSVYRAYDEVLDGELVAIKILHSDLVADERQMQRFLREVQLMRRIEQRNIVRTYDVGTDGEFAYFTMEFVPGRPLEDWASNQSYPLEKLPQLIIEIASGLEAVHQAGIIHRDLKPANILVLEDGTAKITDFGVARPEYSELTAHNEIVGSSLYIAPEIWLGTKMGPAVDLYSLGVILFELTTGMLPFQGDSPAAMMRLHLEHNPEDPKSINPKVPPWMNRLILKLLSKSAVDRPRSAREVIEAVKLHTNPGVTISAADLLPPREVKNDTPAVQPEVESAVKVEEPEAELEAIREELPPPIQTPPRFPQPRLSPQGAEPPVIPFHRESNQKSKLAGSDLSLSPKRLFGSLGRRLGLVLIATAVFLLLPEGLEILLKKYAGSYTFSSIAEINASVLQGGIERHKLTIFGVTFLISAFRVVSASIIFALLGAFAGSMRLMFRYGLRGILFWGVVLALMALLPARKVGVTGPETLLSGAVLGWGQLSNLAFLNSSVIPMDSVEIVGKNLIVGADPAPLALYFPGLVIALTTGILLGGMVYRAFRNVGQRTLWSFGAPVIGSWIVIASSLLMQPTAQKQDSIPAAVYWSILFVAILFGTTLAEQRGGEPGEPSRFGKLD